MIKRIASVSLSLLFLLLCFSFSVKHVYKVMDDPFKSIYGGLDASMY